MTTDTETAVAGNGVEIGAQKGVEIDEPVAPRVLRTPTDVIRLVVAAVALGVSILVTRALPDAVRGLEHDVLVLIGDSNRSVESGVIAVIQIATVYAPL